MSEQAWAIKLGSGGSTVPFCEVHRIVGVGWRQIDCEIVTKENRDAIWAHIRRVYPSDEVLDRTVSNWTGQLFRFGQECKEGDYILYYDPPNKHVRICRVGSSSKYRQFESENDTDIWHYRNVEYPIEPIPILDLYGSLKGKLLGPRMSFWELKGCYATIDAIVRGEKPHVLAAPDIELKVAYAELRRLVIRRLEALQDGDWELLVVDYLKAQGAHVDESDVGGNRAIIDAEARFDHGELGEEIWRVQVKRYQDRRVDWPEIEEDLKRIGDTKFCYVSVFGFTPRAIQDADRQGIRLLEGGDFTLFVLGGKVRDSLKEKIALPFIFTG